MSAAVEPTQPTDEWVQTACRAFQTTVEDFDHLSPDWPDWRDGVAAALTAAYPAMVKQAVADERERIARQFRREADPSREGIWREAVNLLSRIALLDAVDNATTQQADAWDRAVAHVCQMVGTPNVGWRNPYRALGGEQHQEGQ